jgi:hypothetical protein
MRKQLKKTISILVLLLMLNQVFAPTVAFALSSGPTSPEASSFEPIDTTDMVNPLTGDLTYNMPLFEVPGPEGGYPLSLAYHAGIQPNEDASWVGLGWSLNPGAITRNVNGYPDDFKDVDQTVRSYWSGGSTKTFGVDVGIGIGAANVTFGLSFSQDTYKGFGVGASVGVGVGLIGDKGDNVGLGAGVTIGISPYGEPYAGLNLGLSIGEIGKEGMKLGIGVGVNTNFSSLNAGAGAGISYSNGRSGNKNVSASLLGASISSAGGGATVSMGGGSASVNNANSGKIQTQSSGWSFSIPLPGVSIGLSSTYTRYWSDETANVLTNGTLYAGNGISNPADLNNHAFDTYRLLNPNRANIVYSPDPDRLVGGTYPDFDNYNVTAQGLSGNMRPYAYQDVLYAQNKINNNDHNNDVVARIIPANKSNASKYAFRFMNDFSNSYRQNADNPSLSQFTFANATYGNGDGDYGYDANQNKLAGSKNIEYFTNEQISFGTAKSKGFINYTGGGFDRSAWQTYYGKQIGGFMITNASGVTYHYALPVYSMQEEVYTEKISQAGGHTFNKLSKPARYAYTWLLTAVTGPDYVDRNDNGFVDKDDWGYWVEFEYGKWSENYGWRNPSQGFHKDLDADFQNYSSGFKEVYYLNTIKTRSHAAVFEKANRADGKSISEIPAYTNNGGIGSDNIGTVSSLKLNKVYLMKIEDYDEINSNPSYPSLSADWIPNFSHTPDIQLGGMNLQLNTNIIDEKDIQTVANVFKQKSIRTIKFNYDYSLAKGTYNSYDPNFDRYAATPVNTINYPRLGKLTLVSIENFGTNETPSAPPTEFEYDLDPSLAENKDYVQLADDGGVRKIQVSTYGRFQKGDIIRFEIQGYEYYCTLLSNVGTLFNVKYLANLGAPASSGPIEATRTKNPPYHKDYFDVWGMYKSDYTGSTANENLNRVTTPVSNQSVDVWCLRKIKTQLGADINISYEGDDYNKSVLNKSKAFILSNLTVNGLYFTFDINSPDINIGELLKVDDKMDFQLLKQKYKIPLFSFETITTKNFEPVVVTNINGNSVTVRVNQAFANKVAEKDPTEIISIRTGNVTMKNIDRFLGGGIRVKQLEINSLDGYVKRTKYNYKLQNIAGQLPISSGTTAFEPVIFDVDQLSTIFAQFGPAPYVLKDPKDTYIKAYRSELYRDMDYMLSISRELPAPGVMYEYVTVEDEDVAPNGNITSTGGKAAYQYEVFSAGMLGKKEIDFQESSNTRIMNMSMKDYTSRLGNLKRTITYDNNGNKLTEVINHYLHDPIADKSFDTQASQYEGLLSNYQHQGVIQERYGDARTVYENGTPIYRTVMSGRDFYPSILTGSTQIDYKNGTRTKQENLAFDYYNGTITKTLNFDSYGNRFVNEITPAYRVYPAMGLKVNEATNGERKNMLSQQAGSKIYKVDAFNQPLGVIAASAQTWGTDIPVLDPMGDLTTYGQGNVWRQKAAFSWMNDGISTNNITPINNFQDFFSGGSSSALWKKVSDIKLYNVYSNPLEITDIQNIYAATKMGYKNSKIILVDNPSRYDEIAFSGAEDGYVKNSNVTFSGNVMATNGNVTTATAHTGVKSMTLDQGGRTFTYTVPVSKLDPVKRNYIISAWFKPANGDVSGARLFYQLDNGAENVNTPNFQKQANGWYLLEMTIPSTALTSSSLTVGCKNIGNSSFYVDDFRFQPLDASTTAYVYDQHTGELNYVLDNNNLFTKYQYTPSGKLIKIYREVLGKANTPLIKEYSYNYGKFNKTVSSPTTVFARLEPILSSGTPQTGDFYVKFYSDANCTTPLTISSNIQINYTLTVNKYEGTNTTTTTTFNYSNTAPSGNSQFYLTTQVTNDCENIAMRSSGNNAQQKTKTTGSTQRILPPGEDPETCYNRYIILSPGTGYTVAYFN